MPFPIDPTLIALEISNQRFEDPIAAVQGHSVRGIEGMLSKSRTANEWFILFDETVEITGRVRFTISHELGHYLLHRNLSEQFKCGQATMLDYDSHESQSREKEANEFASFLLMPLNDFRKEIEGHEVTLELISHCAEKYRVSITACALKWIKFTDESAILVIARDDFILWSYPSETARRQGIFFKQGTEVPPESQLNLTQGSTTNKSIRMPAGVWHPLHESVETLIVSDKYEMGIFLIRFPFANAPHFDEEQQSDTFDLMKYRIR